MKKKKTLKIRKRFQDYQTCVFIGLSRLMLADSQIIYQHTCIWRNKIGISIACDKLKLPAIHVHIFEDIKVCNLLLFCVYICVCLWGSPPPIPPLTYMQAFKFALVKLPIAPHGQ